MFSCGAVYVMDFKLSGNFTMESDNMAHTFWILKQLGMANFSYVSKQNKSITF